MGNVADRVDREEERSATTAPRAAPAGRTRAGELIALQRSIGNAAVGRLLRDPIKQMDAPADRELGFDSRPASLQFWNAYKQLSYAVFHGEEMRDDVWKFVGGSVGDDFMGGNTCATRVSWAFNNAGWAVKPMQTPANLWKAKFFYNNPKVKVAGKAGDGRWYLVGAPDMESYLTMHWGKRDALLKTNDEAKTFEGTLSPGQVAIFAGAHHSGVIMGQDPANGWSYHDAYVESDPGVMPVSAWKLPA